MIEDTTIAAIGEKMPGRFPGGCLCIRELHGHKRKCANASAFISGDINKDRIRPRRNLGLNFIRFVAETIAWVTCRYLA